MHLVGCLYYLYQWCTVKQISDNEIYLLIKYIKSVLGRVAKRLSYTEDARCLKVKDANGQEYKIITIQLLSTGVMVRIPKHISYSYGTQAIRNVLQLLNTEQKSQIGERTWKQNILHEGLVPCSSTNCVLTDRCDAETSDVDSALEGGIRLDTGERL